MGVLSITTSQSQCAQANICMTTGYLCGHSSMTGPHKSGALSLVEIVEILCSHWLNLTMLYAVAKVYAITTHLTAQSCVFMA